MKNLLGINLLLAIGWCALFGRFDLSHLVTGFLVGFAALSVVSPLLGKTFYFLRILMIVRLLAYFAWQVVMSSIQVAWDVITPLQKSRPAIVAIPLDIDEPRQITVLANLISLTPGSLSLDVSPDQKTLYVHGMFVDDPEEMRRRIKSGFERKVRDAMQ